MAAQALCRFSARPLSAFACFIDALKQRLIVADTDFGQVLIDSFLDLTVCRHFMLFAAFLFKAEQKPFARRIIVFDFEVQVHDGADPGESVGKDPEQSANGLRFF
jgi:hypothetical protein